MGKEFWTAALDTVVALILYFVGKYAGAGIFEDVKFFILAVQPLILALIAKWFVERVEVSIRALRVGK